MQIFRRSFLGAWLFLGALLLAPAISHAQYAFNVAAGNTGPNGTTITLSPTAGSLIVVFSQINGASNTLTLSDNGTGSTWVMASNNVLVGSLRYAVGYCLSAGTGITTITATYSAGTPSAANISAASYTGMTSPSFVAVSAPNVQVSPGTGTGILTAPALATGSTNALLVAGVVDTTATATITAGTGFTRRLNSGSFNTQAIEDPNAEVTGSQTATFTLGTNGTHTFATTSIAFADNAITGTNGPSGLAFRVF